MDIPLLSPLIKPAFISQTSKKSYSAIRNVIEVIFAVQLTHMNSDKKIFVPVLLSLILLAGCSYNQRHSESIRVDLDEQSYENDNYIPADTTPRLSVAVSAIISPRETLAYYEELFNYISEQTGYKIEFKQRRTYQEVNQMVEQQDVDLAFICSGAYTLGKDDSRMDILAIPVINGQSGYQAYVITHESSAINNFEDLRDKRFAYTDPMSHTGRFYADKRVKECGCAIDKFFSKTVYSHAHDVSMQLVAKQVVDGASVSGLIFDYIAAKYPERVKNLRIIERSEYYGMPPIVIPHGLDSLKRSKLQRFLLNAHKDPAGKEILDKLMIDRFVPGNDADYKSIREMLTFISQ